MMVNQIKTEFDVPGKMRDGVTLRANIFRPADDGIYPVALMRTPYGKDYVHSGPIMDAVRLARAGYIVVIQDVRGRFASEGNWSLFRCEDVDGYDTVEWAAGLPGSNGKVGMFGISYMGFTQWMAATQTPPHLKAIMPGFTWADTRDGVGWRGGAFEFGTAARMQLEAFSFDTLVKRLKDAPLPDKVQVMGLLVHEINRLRTAGYFSLPLSEFEPLKRLGLLAMIQEAIDHPNDRARSAPFSPATRYDGVTIPAYNVGGWYDVFTQGTLQNFQALRNNGQTPEAKQSKLLIGPWTHTSYDNVIGEMDFGFMSHMSFMNLQTDMTSLTQRWFDCWLKGIDNGIAHEPPVKIFVMGDNQWRDEWEWPLARTQYTPYYLHAGLKLSQQAPADESPDQYVYDPADPTPVLGGALLMHKLFGFGPADQRKLDSRTDMLRYTSEPLTRDLEVTGPLLVKLWIASDAPDTDFVARLIDVHPDGFAQNLVDGILRARYRNGDAAEMLEPGRAYELTIDLWATSNVFKAGHRIRLDIASASFPRWDRNLNSGEPFGTDSATHPAHQTILHDSEHPTHIILPIIPR